MANHPMLNPDERTSKLPLIAALIVLVLALGGGLALGLISRSSGPSYPKTWDLRIAPLAAIAEKDRGLSSCIRSTSTSSHRPNSPSRSPQGASR